MRQQLTLPGRAPPRGALILPPKLHLASQIVVIESLSSQAVSEQAGYSDAVVAGARFAFPPTYWYGVRDNDPSANDY
jgi:hypothetical protein